MKKIFTLLFCTTIISSAFAQDDRHDRYNRNNTYDNRGQGQGRNDWQNGNNTYNNHGNYQGRHDWQNGNNAYDNRWHGQYRNDDFRNRRGFHVNFIVYGNNQYRFDQRDQLVAQISYDYDYRIQQVINNCELNPHEKRYYIADLQSQKQQAINSVYAQCGNEVGFQVNLNPFVRHHDDDDR